MIDLDKIRAIDIHTHAEEPCGCHSDDGYDDLQSTMAKYFGAPWSHPPTIQETAAHYREQNIAAVIFPVDAERETGYRRYSNDEVYELVKENDELKKNATKSQWVVTHIYNIVYNSMLCL